MNVFEKLSDFIKENHLDKDYPVGFTILQSGNYIVKYSYSDPKIVKTFHEVEQEFEHFINNGSSK